MERRTQPPEWTKKGPASNNPVCLCYHVSRNQVHYERQGQRRTQQNQELNQGHTNFRFDVSDHPVEHDTIHPDTEG